MSQWENNERFLIYQKLASLGDFYSLDIYFVREDVLEQLSEINDGWKHYNPAKPEFKRKGLSLISLNGETTGEIDLNSVFEYNKNHGTNYNEMSFRTPTPFWNKLSSISEHLKSLMPHLGRSHLLKFDTGGFFPPHRDLGNSFRLISIIKGTKDNVHLTLEDKVLSLSEGQLYFLNTTKEHSIVSFDEDTIVLVLNVDICQEALNWVFEKLTSR